MTNIPAFLEYQGAPQASWALSLPDPERGTAGLYIMALPRCYLLMTPKKDVSGIEIGISGIILFLSYGNITMINTEF